MAPLSHLILAFLFPLTLAAQNEINIASSTFLGNHTSANALGTYRDGGWESQIGSKYFQLYADTQVCDPNPHIAGQDCNPFTFRANTIAEAGVTPTEVTDYSTPYPGTFCDSPQDGYRLHLTNIVSTGSNTGVAFYANISNDRTRDIDGAEVGSGVVTVSYNGVGSPVCTVVNQFWGIDSPIYGNHGTVDGRDGFIYLFGALGANSPNYNESTNFLARVPFSNPTDYWAYTYWDGASWSNTPLSNPQTDGAAPASIIKGAPQGSVIWSNHYNQFMYLYPGPFFSNAILAVTSSSLTGPWSEPITLYTGDTQYYAPVAQPHYDVSGKTLAVSMSVFEPEFMVSVVVDFD